MNILSVEETLRISESMAQRRDAFAARWKNIVSSEDPRREMEFYLVELRQEEREAVQAWESTFPGEPKLWRGEA